MKCLCDCGKEFERKYAEIIGSKSSSCGCWKSEISSAIGSITCKNSKSCQKRDWHFIHQGEKIPCRSSYEVLYANYLIDNNIEFEYEPQIFILSNKRRYTPDFWLKNENLYVEVKGLDHGSQGVNREFFIKDGNKLTMLKWDDLVALCKLPCKSQGTYTVRARKLGITPESYFAQRIYQVNKVRDSLIDNKIVTLPTDTFHKQ